jgi:TM2 domain
MKPLSTKSAAVVAFFFGLLGIHRLLMGYKNWWLMPMTLGGLWVWSLFDFIRIVTGKMNMADGTPLTTS